MKLWLAPVPSRFALPDRAAAAVRPVDVPLVDRHPAGGRFAPRRSSGRHPCRRRIALPTVAGGAVRPVERDGRRRREHRRRPDEARCRTGADQGGVRPPADSATLAPNQGGLAGHAGCRSACRAVLRPGGARAGEHPRRRRTPSSWPPIRAVFPSDDSADARAEATVAGFRAAAGELRALLRPGGARAGEHPRRPREAVVVRAADQGGVPVRRQRDARCRTGRRRSRRCRSAWRPAASRRRRAGEHPRRADAAVVGCGRRSGRCSRPPTARRSSRSRPRRSRRCRSASRPAASRCRPSG